MRRTVVGGCLFLLTLVACTLPARGEQVSLRVISVERGDVLQGILQGDTLRVRLYGITCPDPSDPIGQEARLLAGRLVLGKQVPLSIHERHDAGSVIGSVHLPRGRTLAEALLRKGLGRWDERVAPEDLKLETAQQFGQNLGLGLWEEGVPTRPADVQVRPVPAAGTEPPAPGGRRTWLYAGIAALLLGLAALVLLLTRRRGAPRPAAEPTAQPKPETSPAAPPARDAQQAEAIESGRRFVQELLDSLSEFVTEMVEQNTSYTTRMTDRKASVKKAMTLAGIEEIQRLLLEEIDEMQTNNEQYRAQLDEANGKIREQQELMTRFAADARLDFLTQLANRRAFDERIREEFERFKRYGTPFSLILVDIDLFKKVNDTYGHSAGDSVLQLVARTLEDQVRKNDCVGRFGGEEFAILLPETSAELGKTVAEKIRRAVAGASLVHGDRRIKVTISAGVGEAAAQDEAADALVARVDEALYRAKGRGRNCVE